VSRHTERATDPADDRSHGHAALGVALRIEEDLGMDHVVGLGAFQIGPGEVVEILLLQEHGHAPVIEVEEILEIAEAVGSARRLHAAEAELHPVPARQREHHLGLERPLEMEVELGLRQPFDHPSFRSAAATRRSSATSTL
jgi:hypothetical protein